MHHTQGVTFETLDEGWKRGEETLRGTDLGLRMRRALSWLERAEKEREADHDAAFIFYWIAFNAAYARDRQHVPEHHERVRFADYFDTILSLDSDDTIYDAIWDRFSGPIRVLLDNKFVFQPFWNHHAGLGHQNWEHTFESSKRAVRRALAQRDTGVILGTLFDRLYVLRIQTLPRRCNVGQLREPLTGPRRRKDTRLPRAPLRRPHDVPPGDRLGLA